MVHEPCRRVSDFLFTKFSHESLTGSSNWLFWKRPPRAEFSDCGTFVLLAFESPSGPSPLIIHEIDADPVSSRYYPLIRYGYPQNHLTPDGEYVIETEELYPTSYRLVSRKIRKSDCYEEGFQFTSQYEYDQRVYLDNVICYSSRFADSDRFLLLGKNDDEKMRLLIAPREGHALEITPLSLSFNEAKRRLEAEWEKQRALEDKETGGTGEQSVVMEEDSNEDNRREEDGNEENTREEDRSEDGSEENTREEDRSEDRGTT